MNIAFHGCRAVLVGGRPEYQHTYALALAARGARVLLIVHAVDESKLPAVSIKLAEEIQAQGGEVLIIAADAVTRGRADPSATEAVRRWGQVDIVISGSIVSPTGLLTPPSGDCSERRHVACLRVAWEVMCKQGHGRLVLAPVPSEPENDAAVHAVLLTIVNSLRVEGAAYGIRVNALVEAQGISPLVSSESELSLSAVPEDLAPGILYLASAGAPDGVVIKAHGGRFSRSFLVETDGIFLPPGRRTPDDVSAQFGSISDMAGATPVTLSSCNLSSSI